MTNPAIVDFVETAAGRERERVTIQDMDGVPTIFIGDANVLVDAEVLDFVRNSRMVNRRAAEVVKHLRMMWS